MRSWRTIRDQSCLRALNAILLALLLTHSTALAVQMKEDPKGFEGIPWGATLSESETFGKVEDSGRLKTYELKGGPPTFGPAKVESMKFTTVDDRFARVTVRYQGKEAHDQLLGFLQSRYGPLDRTPGQFAGGAVKIFAWQGIETEVSLRYETRTDRGIIFFENPSLASRIEGAMAPDPDLGGATY
ncbi:MAG TPA: hypothetical protein VFT92_06375 [Nitrospira sp.]|nr:hypothetical protein [Nitrospira sp.]